MSLKARVRTDALGNITVLLEGGLDYENGLPLRRQLGDLMSINPLSEITLDMHGLDFVGSSGIGMFVETLQSLNKKREQIKLANVKTEFLKVFKLYDFDALELMLKEFDDDETEDLNMRFGNRRKTFQN